MNKRRGAFFIPFFTRMNRYAINALLGALEQDAACREVEVRIAHHPSDIQSALAEAVERGWPAVIGWSFHSPDFPLACQALNEVKKASEPTPQVIHLAGGAHATADPEGTLSAGFDYVARGEGERIITNLLSRIAAGVEPHQACRSQPGLAYFHEGGLIKQKCGSPIELDDYPPFAPGSGRFNPIELTRGCRYACHFCQTSFMFGRHFRHRSVDNICQYVQLAFDRGLRDMRFITPSALSYGSIDETVNLEAIRKLLAALRKILGEQGRIFFGAFPSEIRPEQITRETLNLLKQYVDNNNIIIGAQSGSQRILDSCHRGHSVEAIISAVKTTLETGFKANVDLIFGLPHETEKDSLATLEIADKLATMGARIHGHSFMPLPGTPFQHDSPTNITHSIMLKLNKLTSDGKIYGQWLQQKEIAQRLIK